MFLLTLALHPPGGYVWFFYVILPSSQPFDRKLLPHMLWDRIYVEMNRERHILGAVPLFINLFHTNCNVCFYSFHACPAGMIEVCTDGKCKLRQNADGYVHQILHCESEPSPICSYHIQGSICDLDLGVCTCPVGMEIMGSKCVTSQSNWPSG